VFVAGQLRGHGVTLQTIHRVYKRLQVDWGTAHPFCRRELLSDGKTVFMRYWDAKGEERLAEALSEQGVFPQVILPFLRHIDYDQVTDLAQRWHIAEGVVVDPGICFGKPVVQEVGIPTAILAAAYHANDEDLDAVAEWYNIPPRCVEAAVAFENGLAAGRAA
jgi:uncharacterized protein (DUF433 family)